MLSVQMTCSFNFFADVTDGASENVGKHAGLHQVFVEAAKNDWIESGKALFSTEFDKRLSQRTIEHYGSNTPLLHKGKHASTYLALKVPNFLMSQEVRDSFRYLCIQLGVERFPYKYIDASRFFQVDLRMWPS